MFIYVWIFVDKNEMYVHVWGTAQINKIRHLLGNNRTTTPELKGRRNVSSHFLFSRRSFPRVFCFRLSNPRR
jgi:hypothetical protein